MISDSDTDLELKVAQDDANQVNIVCIIVVLFWYYHSAFIRTCKRAEMQNHSRNVQDEDSRIDGWLSTIK